VVHQKERAMENPNWKLLKQGFVFGFGLIVPLSIGFILYSVFSYKFYDLFSSSVVPNIADNLYESYGSQETEAIKSIEVVEYRDVKDGDFVVVLGSIKNTSSKPIGSIKLEAEFYNDKGEFVHEESEYISKRLGQNEVENFAIKCGCANRKFPDYSKVTVRVVDAGAF
jgi:hypothetical protein